MRFNFMQQSLSKHAKSNNYSILLIINRVLLEYIINCVHYNLNKNCLKVLQKR